MLQYLKTNIFPKSILAGYVMVNQGIFPNLPNGLDFNINNKDILNLSLDMISAQLGLDKACIVTANQVHQDNVLLVNQKSQDYTLLKTDAIVTQNLEIIPSVRSADCGNILLFDPKTGIRAAIHSGYRGTGLNIANKTVDLMTKLGCIPSDILAFIGPSIAQNALWVWQESAKLCPTEYKIKIDESLDKNQNIFKYLEYAKKEIQNFPQNQKPAFLLDLNGWIKYQLLESGLDQKNIEICDVNTFEDRHFHSQRRARIIDKTLKHGLGLGFMAFKN